MTARVAGCVLCDGPGGRVVRNAARWRVVHVTEPGFPAYYRVIWHTHLPEFTQLSRDERIECIDVVAAIEQAMLRELQPAKVNLASFGNRVPHLHWHVIGRFDWDSHHPEQCGVPGNARPRPTGWRTSHSACPDSRRNCLWSCSASPENTHGFVKSARSPCGGCPAESSLPGATVYNRKGQKDFR
jgi:diadenosine tetraphosphate (Ap4A) HIT family hydrolase